MPSRLRDTLLDLLRFERGHSTFVVDADGEWAPTETVTTVKMRAGEPLEAFHLRLRRDYGMLPGDTIAILNNGGKVDTARITRRPR